MRALLTARKLVQAKLHDIEMSLRGILRGFGLKVGRVMTPAFPRRGPDAGTMDQVRPQPGPWLKTTLT